MPAFKLLGNLRRNESIKSNLPLNRCTPLNRRPLSRAACTACLTRGVLSLRQQCCIYAQLSVAIRAAKLAV
jgi:hypothetical protein